jgi:uncharacterized phiE125 gp8 family phage protein
MMILIEVKTHMALKLLSGPALEPVSPDEAKLYLRVDQSGEDDTIILMIGAARELFERETGVILIDQSWLLTLDAWPLRGSDGKRRIHFPLRPVSTIASVTSSVGGTPTDVPSTDYVLDVASAPPRLVEPVSGLWPKTDAAAAGIAVTFTAGFGAASTDVPAAIRLALLKLVAEAYEGRAPLSEGAMPATADGVAAILAPYREVRL